MSKVKLKEISSQISSGLTPLRTNADFWHNGDIYWLKTEQLWEKNIFSTNEKINRKALNETSIKLYPTNTLSIAMYGEGRTRGNVSILKSEMTTNQACCNIVLNPQKADYEYVYYYLKTQYENLRSLSSGVRKNLNSNDIKEYEIFLPKAINEQQKIAAVLSALDDKIELNNRINAELEQMSKTLYDYWFVQLDFPDVNGKPYKSSGGKMVYNEVLKRNIPVDWKVENLDCLLVEFTKGITTSYVDKSNSINLNQKVNKGFKLDRQYFKYLDESIEIPESKFARQKDILINSLGQGTLGRIHFFLDTVNNIVVDQHLFILRTDTNVVYPSYLYHTLNSNAYQLQIERQITGSTGMQMLNAANLKDLQILLPDKIITKSFEEMVFNFYEKVEINERQNQQLSALRDWLLPMLMNGQVKVMDVAKEYNAAEEQPALAAESLTTYEEPHKLNIPDSRKNFAKQVLAGKIVSQFKDDPNFTDIKFQKIQFLAEHIIEADLTLNYYYQAAGPYDNVFMHTVYNDFRKQKWFDCQNKRFVPLEKQGKIEEYYQGYFAPAQWQLNELFELLYQTTEAEAEIIATLYAVWNNRIIEKRSITDEELIRDFYQWSDRKQQYSEEQVIEGLQWLRTHQMEPKGFGKLIKKTKSKK